MDPIGQTARPQPKMTKVIVDTSGLHCPPTVSATGENYFPPTDDDVFMVHRDEGLDGTEGPAGYTSETDMSMHSGATSLDQARSTLAEAIT